MRCLQNDPCSGKDLPIFDSQSERKWSFALSLYLERAKREDEVNLLKGIAFYVTPKVEIDVRLLKAVVASAGGQVSFFISKLCRLSVPHPHKDSDVKGCRTVGILNANENRHVVSCPADNRFGDHWFRKDIPCIPRRSFCWLY